MSSPRAALAAQIAACSAQADGVALAPCFYEIPSVPGADPGGVWIQATPAGAFRARDGRPSDAEAWRIDDVSGPQIAAAVNANRTPLVVDYEHQTLHAETNGQPAPAAAFIRRAEWRAGSGLWVQVEFNARARAYIADGEYRYFSPVFSYRKGTGEILSLVMGALTNNPAIDGMTQLELRAAARFAVTPSSETPDMLKNKLLIAICAALAIDTANKDEAALDAEALAALGKIKPGELTAALTKAAGADQLRTQLCAALGVTADADDAALLAACAKKEGGQPDPAKFVPIEGVKGLQQEVAALTARVVERDVDDLVRPAIDDGRLPKALEGWARELGKKDVAALRAYLDKAQPIAALSGSQTDGKQPASLSEDGLTSEELAICSATGVEPKQFALTKKAQAGQQAA